MRTFQPRRTLLFSCISVFLLSLFCSIATVSALDDDADKPVTCGSAIKLNHIESKTYLNSEPKNLGGGSGQQIVTFVSESSASGTMWWLRAGEKAPDDCAAATPVPCNAVVRLTNLDTMRNLHTHHYKSPLSRQQEITAFGDDGKGDQGDDWKVVCLNGKATHWMRGDKVALQHVDTQAYLGASSTVKFTASNCGNSCPIMNHLEAFGRNSRDNYAQFQVDSGVLLSR